RARARGARRRLVLLPVGLAHYQDRNRPETIVPREPREDRGSVHVGQVEVEHDERGARRVTVCALALEEGERIRPVLDRVDHERVAEDAAGGAQEALVVVDHEDGREARGHAASPPAGRRTVKRLPSPGCESTDTEPPCVSTMRFTIARPTPVPPTICPSTTCSAPGTRPKRSKIPRWYASAMPIPLSPTQNTAAPFSVAPPTSTRPRPAGTYLRALARRFVTTCSSFRGSAKMRGSGPTDTPICFAAICGRSASTARSTMPWRSIQVGASGC